MAGIILAITENMDNTDLALDDVLFSLLDKKSSFPLPERSKYPAGYPEHLKNERGFVFFTTYYESQPEFKMDALNFRKRIIDFLDCLNSLAQSEKLAAADNKRVLVYQRKWDGVLYRYFQDVYSPKETSKGKT